MSLESGIIKGAAATLLMIDGILLGQKAILKLRLLKSSGDFKTY